MNSLRICKRLPMRSPFETCLIVDYWINLPSDWHDRFFDWRDRSFDWHDRFFDWRDRSSDWNNRLFDWCDRSSDWYDRLFDWRDRFFDWRDRFSDWHDRVLDWRDRSSDWHDFKIKKPCKMTLQGFLYAPNTSWRYITPTPQSNHPVPPKFFQVSGFYALYPQSEK